jgi:hypothetical protein
MEAVLHTSYDCLFIAEDYGKPWEARFINVWRKLSCCTEQEETTDCRKEPPVGILFSLIYAEI